MNAFTVAKNWKRMLPSFTTDWPGIPQPAALKLSSTTWPLTTRNVTAP